MSFDNIIGKTFNRWTVLAETTEKNKRREELCLAICSCGTKRLVIKRSVLSGKTKSCGCIAAEKTAKRNMTHGNSKHPLYARWNAMIKRCHLPSDSRYRFYGARGVTVCAEWKESPQNFYDWYESQGGDLSLTVDRIDTFGSYSPENCRLIPQSEQLKNLRPRKDKIPDETIREIKHLISKGVPVSVIANKTDISRYRIHAIKAGRTYKNIN